MPRPVFKTGLAGIALAGEFDSLPPPPPQSIARRAVIRWHRIGRAPIVESIAPNIDDSFQFAARSPT